MMKLLSRLKENGSMSRYSGVILLFGLLSLMMIVMIYQEASATDHGGVNRRRNSTPTWCTPPPTETPATNTPGTGTPTNTPPPTDTPGTGTPTDTPQPTDTPGTGTPTNTPEATDTPGTGTPTDTPQPTETPVTGTPTNTPPPTHTPAGTNTPYHSPTPYPTDTPVPTPTLVPTNTPASPPGTSTPSSSCSCEILGGDTYAINLGRTRNISLSIASGDCNPSEGNWGHSTNSCLDITSLGSGNFQVRAECLPREYQTISIMFTYADGVCDTGSKVVDFHIFYEATPGTPNPTSGPWTPSPTPPPNTPTPEQSNTPTNTPQGGPGTPCHDVTPSSKTLTVPYVSQGDRQWCFAAAAKMIFDYYGSPSMELCEVVNAHFVCNPDPTPTPEPSTTPLSFPDCCLVPTCVACNQGGFTSRLLICYGYSNTNSPASNFWAYHEYFPNVVGEILANRPMVASFWNKSLKRGHSTVVVGYDYENAAECTDPIVKIKDPAVSQLQEIEYSDLNVYRQGEYSINYFLFDICP